VLFEAEPSGAGVRERKKTNRRGANKMTRIRPFRTLQFLTAVLVAAAMFTSSHALAAPKGIDPAQVGKLLFNFNIHAVPNEWVADDSTCPNSGHRIFFTDATSGSIGTILWTVDPAQSQIISILDCDGTTDHEADIQLNGAGKFYVFARLFGPLRSSVNLSCADTDLLNEALCLIGTVSLNRTNSKDVVKIMDDLFADNVEGVTWTQDNSTGFRIMQVRIYQAR